MTAFSVLLLIFFVIPFIPFTLLGSQEKVDRKAFTLEKKKDLIVSVTSLIDPAMILTIEHHNNSLHHLCSPAYFRSFLTSIPELSISSTWLPELSIWNIVRTSQSLLKHLCLPWPLNLVVSSSAETLFLQKHLPGPSMSVSSSFSDSCIIQGM